MIYCSSQLHKFWYVLWYACLTFVSYYADHIVQVVDLFLYFERWNMMYCLCMWILTDRQVKMANLQTDMQTIISSPFTWLIIFSLWLIQPMCQAVFIIIIIKILTWVQKYSSSYKSASRVPSKLVKWSTPLSIIPFLHSPPSVTLHLYFQ